MHQINYKITVQYEGTRYKGWQKQPRIDNTVQGKLETLLSRLLDTDIEVFGAGRTDAGVHALGQVANFWVSEEWLNTFTEKFPSLKASWSSTAARAQAMASAGKNETSGSRRSALVLSQDTMLLETLNHYLPDDIAIPKIVRASDRFHARYLTSSKWYRYRIRITPYPDVVNRRFLWQYGEDLDTDAMVRASRALIGTHDFTSFCGLKMKKSAVRTITKIDISRPDADTIVLDYCGDGFLNHMVRLLTGELVEVGSGRAPGSSIQTILEAQKKGAACHTAPASGLTLMEVNY
jgi:tRNA pseudouridine38-40 synthase